MEKQFEKNKGHPVKLKPETVAVIGANGEQRFEDFCENGQITALTVALFEEFIANHNWNGVVPSVFRNDADLVLGWKEDGKDVEIVCWSEK